MLLRKREQLPKRRLLLMIQPASNHVGRGLSEQVERGITELAERIVTRSLDWTPPPAQNDAGPRRDH